MTNSNKLSYQKLWHIVTNLDKLIVFYNISFEDDSIIVYYIDETTEEKREYIIRDYSYICYYK